MVIRAGSLTDGKQIHGMKSRSSSRLDYFLLLVVLRYGTAVLFRDRSAGCIFY